MKRFRFIKASRIAITTLISLSVILLCWLVPVFPLEAPQSKVFAQVWETVNENFFDPNFNGVDWKGIRSKYEQKVKQAQSSEEVAVIVNQMLSELKSSHTHFYTADDPAYYQILGIFVPMNPNLLKPLKTFFPKGRIEYSGIGISTKDINGKTFVSAILDGSPAADAGLKVGDQLLSVDGQPFQPIGSFKGKAGEKVKVSIQRSPTANSQQEIVVTPKLLDGTTMFVDAMNASTQVIEREGQKIGYVHIWSYAGDKYQEQLEQELIYGRLKDADGLVLDLREGWCGAYPNYLNIFTARTPSITSIPRNGTRRTYSYQWKKPVVMLVNEGSRSGKEILAFGFQRYSIGQIVGSKTAGAVLAGSPFIMSDGSILYLAVANVYVDGEQRLEGKGVTPDIIVPRSLEYAQGSDPQKDRALLVALEAVKQRK